MIMEAKNHFQIVKLFHLAIFFVAVALFAGGPFAGAKIQTRSATGNEINRNSRISKKPLLDLNSALAATFDSSLVPGGATGNLDIGSDIQYWSDMYLGGNFNVIDGKVYQPENFDSAHNGRGQMAVGVPVDVAGAYCGDIIGVKGICSYHTGHCDNAISYIVDLSGLGGIYASCTTPLFDGGICFCD